MQTGELQMRQIRHFLKEHNAVLTIVMMAAATLCSFIFFFYVPSGSVNITLFYVLALIVIARYTKGYRYGVTAALFCVVFINYFFYVSAFQTKFYACRVPSYICSNACHCADYQYADLPHETTG